MECWATAVAIQKLRLTVADCVNCVVWQVSSIGVQHDHVYRCRQHSFQSHVLAPIIAGLRPVQGILGQFLI